MGNDNSLIKVAAMDCGTNSIRLLIACVNKHNNKIIDLQERKTYINRLGYGVDETGEFDKTALEKTFEFEKEFAIDIKNHEIPIENIRFVATSASRDAKNRDVFFSKTYEILNVYPEIISGESEAKLSFNGVACAINTSSNKIVVDLGGGSTELITGKKSMIAGFSMNIGSVRITERFFGYDQERPNNEQIKNAEKCINEAIDEAFSKIGISENISEPQTIIGVAGTVTTITAYYLKLEKYNREKINGAKISCKDMIRCCEEIIEMNKDEIRALKFVMPGRVDVIQAGCLIWKTLLERISKITQIESIICSEHDILDGIALSILSV